jgi:hypothetical protein
MSSDSFRDMLAVEIEANLEKGLAVDNPLSIEMWKGYTSENPNQMELDFELR